MSSNAACVIGASVFEKKCRCSDCFVLKTKMLKVIRTEFVSLVVGPQYVCFSLSVTLIKEPRQVLNIGLQKNNRKEVLMFIYVDLMVTKNSTSLRAL